MSTTKCPPPPSPMIFKFIHFDLMNNLNRTRLETAHLLITALYHYTREPGCLDRRAFLSGLVWRTIQRVGQGCRSLWSQNITLFVRTAFPPRLKMRMRTSTIFLPQLHRLRR